MIRTLTLSALLIFVSNLYATDLQTAEAIARDQHVLQGDAKNKEALADIVDQLDGAGRWKEALPYLSTLNEVEPNDAARAHQLGMYYSWSDNGSAKALPMLQHASELQPNNSQYAYDYADVLARGSEHRAEALQVLRSIVEHDPKFLPAISRLAEILSWSGASRAESGKLYQQGLALEPRNLELLDGYGEMLSWDHTTRPQAELIFNRALETRPNDPRALVGKAQLLAWSGRSDEALAMYDSVLRTDPHHPTALRGRAEILNWKGRYAEARDLLLQAKNTAPDDPGVSLELARSEAGLGHFAYARSILHDIASGSSNEGQDLRQAVSRALGTWVEVGYMGRRNRRNLDYDRATLLVSTPINSSNRFTFGYKPTFWGTKTGDFDSHYFMGAIDSQVSEQGTTHVQIGVEDYPNHTTQVDAGADLNYRFNPSWAFDAGFERAAVEESMLSTRGIELNGVTFGAVRSNLGHIGLGYSSQHGHWDASLHYTDGLYTGETADSNRRYGVDLDLGKMIRSDKPYLRLSYGVSYMSFDHDADFLPGGAPPELLGGYFSPTRYLLNYGGLGSNWRFGNKVEWRASTSLGVQNVETTGSDFSNPGFAATVSSNLLWRATPTNEIRLGYDFLNVYNAFRRHLVSVSWRHYF
jgi:tetratricopeptide (TPR) repeat protein